jgi:hypothetical protein
MKDFENFWERFDVIKSEIEAVKFRNQHPTKTDTLEAITKITNILHKEFENTSYVYMVLPDMPYGCGISFSTTNERSKFHGFTTTYYVDLTEFSAAEQIIIDTMNLSLNGLSNRAQNALKQAYITTIGGLCIRSKVHLLKYRNIGKKVINEIDEYLASFGLHTGMELPPHVLTAIRYREANYLARS